MNITGKKIRTIIVEDELPIREEILELAMQSEDLQIIGVGKNGKDLAELLDQKKPDLALLDIELPVVDTMTVLAEKQDLPQIIFITAYEMYAPKAFEIAAIDFLVKPVKKERFNKALLRAVDRIKLDKASSGSGKKTSDIFWVRENDKVVPIPIHSIAYLEAQDKTTMIYLDDTKSFTVLRPLSSMLKQLEAVKFLQIHRKYAVNVTAILEMHPMFHGRYELAVKGTPKKLPVSRRYASNILKKS